MKTLFAALVIGAVGMAAGVAYYAHAQEQEQTDGSSGATPGMSGQGMMGQGMMGQGMMGQGMMGPGLMMPSMDAARGRQLFASKGCVVCHSINGVGGEDAPPLDASTMAMPMNPFEFAAKMWRGAEAMVALQREELGEPIQLTGEELADIIAFVHHAEEQHKFSQADIPPRIKGLMHHMEHMGGEEEHEEEGAHESDEPEQ